MATLIIKADKNVISDIVDLETEYNMECDKGHELNAMLVDANTLAWYNEDDSDLTNMIELVERYDFSIDLSWH